ncbi:class III extradiol ring-cleavage dioxygenase [Undibacterium luofuense]|uniref:DODA-type extradiol aromatic ring-opening family dioxygenase n=1 Tax=Undibacterium luofuense TaxID=2828733 RepID=UPI0030ECAB6C
MNTFAQTTLSTPVDTLETGARQPVFFMSHGGGPWPYMEGAFHALFAPLGTALRAVPHQLPQAPRAVLVISAHWEEPVFTVSTAAKPGMLYDYYGFPPHTYSVRYPAPGSPEIGQRIAGLLSDAGWPVATDDQRGFDHGTFCMMQEIYPDASVPVVQMSLKHGLDPAEHIALGKLLQPLRDEGVLIIGSGQSFHNLRLHGAAARQASEVFDQWLQQAMALPQTAQRHQALTDWAQAPAARLAHPREEHLLPLMVIAGAAGDDAAHLIFSEFLADSRTSAFRFGS